MTHETESPKGKAAVDTEPPDRGDITQQLTKRIEWWKLVVGAVALVFAAGVSFAAWTAHYVSRDEADRMRTNLDTSIVSLSAATSANLNTLSAATAASVQALGEDMQKLRERVAKSETKIDWMAATLYDMGRHMGLRGIVPPPPMERLPP